MSGQSLEPLRERLLRAGVSQRYARRLISELQEHRRHLTDELTRSGLTADDAHREARRRLGADDDIVASVLATKRFRSLAHRAPLLVFALGPVLAVPMLAVVLTMLSGMCVFFLWSEFGLLNQHQAIYLYICVFIGIMPAVFALTAAGAVAYACRCRCSLLWPLVTAALLASLAAILRFDYGAAGASDTGGSEATAVFAIAIATSAAYYVALALIPFLTVVAGWGLYIRSNRPFHALSACSTAS